MVHEEIDDVEVEVHILEIEVLVANEAMVVIHEVLHMTHVLQVDEVVLRLVGIFQQIQSVQMVVMVLQTILHEHRLHIVEVEVVQVQ